MRFSKSMIKRAPVQSLGMTSPGEPGT
jgi:hypothetical protein